MLNDRIIFRDLVFQMSIGCFEPERMFKQAIVVEFEAEISRIPKEHWDDPKYIVLDYAIASKILKEYLESKPFRLIETAADGVADLLMKSFPIISLKVSLTKRPKDMPQGSSVTYICHR